MDEQHFIGRSVSLEDARASADTIVVARITHQGSIDLGPPGAAYYFNVKIDIQRTLYGNLTGGQTISFISQTMPEPIAESVPPLGELFLFFLSSQDDGTFRAIKALPATYENVRLVEQTIRI
jgi:hypothetical protein